MISAMTFSAGITTKCRMGSDGNVTDATLAVGAHCQLTIIDIAFGGEGVGRLDDFVIFVPFVLIGEEVEAEVTELKKRFARARLIKVLRASPDRAQPLCPYFGECGGCQYQHMSYDVQLSVKQKQIS